MKMKVEWKLGHWTGREDGLNSECEKHQVNQQSFSLLDFRLKSFIWIKTENFKKSTRNCVRNVDLLLNSNKQTIYMQNGMDALI